MKINTSNSVFVLVIMLSMVSCVLTSNSKQNAVDDVCNGFIINITNADSRYILTYTKLKRALENKFDLITTRGDRFCEIIINGFETKSHSSLISTSGVASRDNVRLKVKYEAKTPKGAFKNTCIIMYNRNVSDAYYSHHVNDLKIDENNVETVAEKMFFYVVRDIKMLANRK